MNENEQIIYNEVYYVLHVLGDKYINKIPIKLYEFIKSNKGLNEIDYIDKAKNIADQLSEDTVTFISYLNLEYWCSGSEKERLLNVYKNNDIIAEKNKREKYNLDNIFENKIQNKLDNQLLNINLEKENTNVLIQYEEKKWFEKICDKVKKWIIAFFR